MDIHWHPLTCSKCCNELHEMSWNVMEYALPCHPIETYWNQFLVPQPGPRSQFHHPASFKALWMSFGVLTKTACTKFSKILRNCQGFKNSVLSHALPDSIIFTSFQILMVIPPYKPCSLSLRSTISHISQFLPDSDDPTSTICSTVPVAHLAPLAFKPWICHVLQRRRSWGKQKAPKCWFSRSWASFPEVQPIRQFCIALLCMLLSPWLGASVLLYLSSTFLSAQAKGQHYDRSVDREDLGQALGHPQKTEGWEMPLRATSRS